MQKATFFAIITFFLLASYSSATTITVDGTAEAAWGSADVAQNPDYDTDEPGGDNNADIIKNAVTDDETNLFVMFEVDGTVFSTATNFLVFIDTDNSAATGEVPWFSPIGADYRINFGGSGGAVTFYSIDQYTAGVWAAVSYGVTIASVGSILEVGISLADIGSPSGTIAIATYGQDTVAWALDTNNDPGADPILHTLSGGPSGIILDGEIADWTSSLVSAVDADTSDPCIPDSLDLLEVEAASDGSDLYVRLQTDDAAFWAPGYTEYRIWIDTDPATTSGYQPYIDNPGCIGNPTCIHWTDFYADYHATISGWEETNEDDNLFLNCSVDSCKDSAALKMAPHVTTHFDAVVGSNNVEFKIPLALMPDFDPDCFELTFTSYDAGLVGSCTTPGDNLPDYGTPDGIGITTGCTVLIALESFTAEPGNGKVTLSWMTSSEVDNAGFNIYRAGADGEYGQINAALIPATGSATEGAVYEFVDGDAKNRTAYSYKLEDVDLDGTVTSHDPVSATPRLIYGIRK